MSIVWDILDPKQRKARAGVFIAVRLYEGRNPDIAIVIAQETAKRFGWTVGSKVLAFRGRGDHANVFRIQTAGKEALRGTAVRTLIQSKGAGKAALWLRLRCAGAESYECSSTEVDWRPAADMPESAVEFGLPGVNLPAQHDSQAESGTARKAPSTLEGRQDRRGTARSATKNTKAGPRPFGGAVTAPGIPTLAPSRAGSAQADIVKAESERTSPTPGGDGSLSKSPPAAVPHIGIPGRLMPIVMEHAKAGKMLPPAAELAHMLNCKPDTVRNGLFELKARGLIDYPLGDTSKITVIETGETTGVTGAQPRKMDPEADVLRIPATEELPVMRFDDEPRARVSGKLGRMPSRPLASSPVGSSAVMAIEAAE